ncbi:MAG TPA: HlyD family type I secretion periplasmic adaptor subunit [Roseomonas sp.]|jgi:HlyD family secretion protein
MSASRLPVPLRSDDNVVLLEFRPPTTALVDAKPPMAARVLPWLILAMVVSMLTAATLLPVDRVVIAQGRIISQTPTIRLQPLETAIVRSLDVRVGQVVHAGEVVARLDPTFAAADLTALEDRYAALEPEVRRLEAENAGIAFEPAPSSPAAVLQASLFAQRHAERAFRLEIYRQRAAGTQSNIGRAEAEAGYLRQRLQLATQIEAMRRDLERQQVGSRLNALVATDNRVEMTRSLAIAEATSRAGREELLGTQAESDAYDRQWRGQVSQDLVARQRELADVREQINKARLRRELVELTAPGDGIVLSVARVSVGSVMQPGTELITIVPLNAALEVEAEVNGRDAGFVHAGQTVDIKLDSFPFMRYGKLQGRIRVMSPDSFVTDEQGRPTAPLYRARVSIQAIQLHNVQSDFRLVPGMPVTVDIRVGERNVVTYFFDRFLQPATEAFREP